MAGEGRGNSLYIHDKARKAKTKGARLDAHMRGGVNDNELLGWAKQKKSLLAVGYVPILACDDFHFR